MIVFAIHNCKMEPNFQMEHLTCITITSSPKLPFLIACIASVSVRVRWEIACSRRSDSGVWREGKEREKNKEENRDPTPRCFFFSSHLFALSPRDLNAWNRLVEKGGNQRLCNNFTVNGATFWTITQLFIRQGVNKAGFSPLSCLVLLSQRWYFGRAKAPCLCWYCCNRHLWFYDGGRLGRVKLVTLRVGAREKEGKVLQVRF